MTRGRASPPLGPNPSLRDLLHRHADPSPIRAARQPPMATKRPSTVPAWARSSSSAPFSGRTAPAPGRRMKATMTSPKRTTHPRSPHRPAPFRAETTEAAPGRARGRAGAGPVITSSRRNPADPRKRSPAPTQRPNHRSRLHDDQGSDRNPADPLQRSPAPVSRPVAVPRRSRVARCDRNPAEPPLAISRTRSLPHRRPAHPEPPNAHPPSRLTTGARTNQLAHEIKR